ncbi:MAG: GFA family protein [Rhodobacterales bacterium]
MTPPKTGHCLCRAVTYEYGGPENWMAHCHCESCRRVTSSGFTSFLGVPNGHWRWTGDLPKTFQSSPKVTRSFCGTCGAQVAYQSTDYPDEIHFYAALLDDALWFQPTQHVHSDEQLLWVILGDDLRRK